METYPSVRNMLDEAYIEDRFTVAGGMDTYRKTLLPLLPTKTFDEEMQNLSIQLREIAADAGVAWDKFLKVHPLELADMLGISRSHFHEVNAKINGIM